MFTCLAVSTHKVQFLFQLQLMQLHLSKYSVQGLYFPVNPLVEAWSVGHIPPVGLSPWLFIGFVNQIFIRSSKFEKLNFDSNVITRLI